MNLLSTALKIALGVLLALTSTVARTNAAPSAPLTIDVVLSMTGAGATLGKDESLAFAIFEKTSNAKGGINGQPVHFEIHDDATNPQVAVQLASAILARAPAVFMGSSLAASCAAMAALVPQGPVQFCLSPAFEPKNGAYTFGAGGSVGYLLPASFNYIRNGGYTRVASIATSDASGVSGERSMDDAIALPENRNIKLVAREHFGADRAYSRLRCAVSFCLYDWIGTRDCASWFERCWNESASICYYERNERPAARELRKFHTKGTSFCEQCVHCAGTGRNLTAGAARIRRSL